MKSLLILSLLVLLVFPLFSQEAPKEKYNPAFKDLRAINGHTSEVLGKRTLSFGISHRFGTVDGGYYTFFGLDEYANFRLGFDYGLTDKLTVGIGRSRLNKYHDAYMKYQILQQTEGGKNFPFTLTALGSVAVNGVRFTEDEEKAFDFSHRLSYTFQLLLARKFSEKLGIQIVPSFIHKNLTSCDEEENTTVSLGGTLRHKLTRTMYLTAEYHHRFNNTACGNNEFQNPIGIGLEFQTFNHLFALNFTNTVGLIEKQFITETTDDFFGGDIRFGFQISRIFRF